ncbi:MAG TPA: GNVR domain-containing protein [Gemmatimonadales bacterium]|nr:GNVR domain-containing protein [Gemmatimonadales bacterium]
MSDDLSREVAPQIDGNALIVPQRRPPVRLEPLGVGPEEPPDWQRHWLAVLRYRWWIVGFAVLGALAGAAGSILTAGYEAQATIWIQGSEPRASDRGPIGARQLFASNAWADLLKSYIVLDDVVRELRAYVWPDVRHRLAFAAFDVDKEFRPGRYRLLVDRSGGGFRLEAQHGVELQRGVIGDSVGRALGFRWAPSAEVLPPGSDVTFTVQPLRDAARALGSGLRVSLDESANFLRLSLTGQDAAAAATTVNTVAQRYVTVATELKRAKHTELAKLLEEQLQAARGNLRRSENALEQFGVRTITLPDPRAPAASAPSSSAAADAPPSEFFALKLEQDRLRRDQQAIEQALSQLRDSSGSVEGLVYVDAVQHSAELSQTLRELTTKRAELRALRYRYTDDYPTVRRLTGEIQTLEGQTIPTLAQALLAELRTRQRALVSEVTAGGRELQGIPPRALEEARLRRDVTIAENLYTSVQQRYDEARLAEASSTADVRILDAAVAPQQPVKDRRLRLLAVGLIAGLGLGLVGAVVADRFDRRVRYPDQVTRQMGLPILGVVPRVTDRHAGPADEHIAHVIEAMRSVRLSLSYAYGAAGPVQVTVTSPGVGDGKSFVSANLALAYAEAGQRTLLIDGDARRGGLHRALQTERKPGLTDFLAGHAPLEVVTRSTIYPSLDFIGAGTRFRDSPELLGSATMAELLARLRSSYRVILVDSPPLGSGVDPYTLGTLTGNMLLVVRTGATNLDLALTKIGMLERLPIRLVGVVLNDVRPGGAYQYYSYAPRYGTADEGVAIATHRPRGVL